MEVNNENADSMSPTDLQAMLVCTCTSASIATNVLITRMRIFADLLNGILKSDNSFSYI